MTASPKSSALSLLDYLGHIVTACARVTDYIAGLSHDRFLATPMVQDAVVRNLEVIGEAGTNVQKYHAEFFAGHPEIRDELRSAYAMRNRLAHGYFEIDWAIVWQAITVDIPALHAVVAAALAELREADDS